MKGSLDSVVASRQVFRPVCHSQPFYLFKFASEEDKKYVNNNVSWASRSIPA